MRAHWRNTYPSICTDNTAGCVYALWQQKLMEVNSQKSVHRFNLISRKISNSALPHRPQSSRIAAYIYSVAILAYLGLHSSTPELSLKGLSHQALLVHMEITVGRSLWKMRNCNGRHCNGRHVILHFKSHVQWVRKQETEK